MVALVGRSEQLAVIDGAISDVAGGRLGPGGRGGGLVLVTGEAGIGKTALGLAALELALSHGLRTAHGYAVDDAGAPVLWPWRRAARRLPELDAVLPQTAPSNLDDDTVRFTISQAVAEALARAAEPSGLLMLLDDLHWADSLSVAVLRHAAFDLAGSGVVVVATARNDSSAPFSRAMPDLLRSGTARHIALSGLTPSEVLEWLTRDGDPTVSQWSALADDLVSRTDGNPFYLRVVTSEAAPLAGSLDDLLARRSGIRGILVSPYLALPDDARHTIATAALMSERLSPQLLAAATSRSVAQVTDHIATATRSGLLQHGPVGLSFVHALVRDAVIAHTARDERAAAEASIARAMEATGDQLLIGPSAMHWDRAEGPVASARCRDGSRLAASLAAAAHAPEEAVTFARMSVRHARRLGSQGADLAERLAELAEYEWLASLVPAAIATCVEAVDVAEAAGRPDLMARAALVPQGIGSLEVARVVGELCRRALTGLPDGELATRAVLTSLQAVAAAEEAVDNGADLLSAEALDLARTSGSAQAELEAMAARHFALSYPQAIEEREVLARRAVELGRSSPTAMGFLWGHLWQADIALQRGELGSLDTVMNEIGRVAAQRSSPIGRWHEHRLRAQLAAVLGDFADARAEAEAGEHIAQRVGDPSMVGMSLAFHVQLAHLRGDAGEIPHGALLLLEHAPPIPLLQASIAQTLALAGDSGRAVAILDQLRDLPERMPLGPRWMGTVGQIGLAAAAVNDAELAWRCHELLAPTTRWYAADGGGTPFFHGSNEYIAAVLALAGGNVTVAKGHFERAVAANLRISARPYVALARLGMARCMADELPAPAPFAPSPSPSQPASRSSRSSVAGSPVSAVSAAALAAEAADAFRQLDMPGPLRQAERLIARLPADAGDHHGLTRRELDVAHLVGEAMTNRQIADRLFLSVRTVESHVRSALTKLHFTTRTELALWVRGQGRE